MGVVSYSSLVCVIGGWLVGWLGGLDGYCWWMSECIHRTNVDITIWLFNWNDDEDDAAAAAATDE